MKKLAKTAVVGSLVTVATVASANPFAAKNMPNGYQNGKADTSKVQANKATTAKKAEAKCGEAKCGGTAKPAKVSKATEAKCGEAKCGAAK